MEAVEQYYRSLFQREVLRKLMEEFGRALESGKIAVLPKTSKTLKHMYID